MCKEPKPGTSKEQRGGVGGGFNERQQVQRKSLTELSIKDLDPFEQVGGHGL